MGAIATVTLAIAVAAACLLVAGGIRLIRLGEFRQKGWLMIVAAMVLVGNVLIWVA